MPLPVESTPKNVEVKTRLPYSIYEYLKGFGNYPKWYNPKIHGAYDPSRYYGPPDTPLGDVKLSNLFAWLSRRHYGPRGIVQGIFRAQYKWAMKYLLTKNTTHAPIIQLCVLSGAICYFVQYPKHKNERHCKYH